MFIDLQEFVYQFFREILIVWVAGVLIAAIFLAVLTVVRAIDNR